MTDLDTFVPPDGLQHGSMLIASFIPDSVVMNDPVEKLFLNEAPRLVWVLQDTYRATFEQACDAVQDAFLATWVRVGRHGPVADAKPYVYKAAKHALWHIKERESKRRALEEEAERAAKPRHSPDETSMVDDLSESDRVVALARLSDREAEVFRLRYHDELAIAEIARALNLGESTVKTNLNRAHKKIEPHLRKEGGS